MPLQKIEVADPVKSDDGTGSIDFIRQTIGKQPYLSVSRSNENSLHWNHIFPQEYGWPLHFFSPVKFKMQKCDKCSREFCSTIGYRRHLRLHRRKLNLNKDSATKNKEMLQAFWDKLSVEEAMGIVSLDDVLLEGIPGSSITKELASFARKSDYTSLPQGYAESGTALLYIVQGRPLSFPISSEKLFKILDEASENTFLCAGTAESLLKFVFDGDAGKIGLEMRNLVACASFLVEQKLVKACLADKDVEALNYQKLLVDEEEATQNRQVALMEKKRQKKLRQKEQREKELINAENDDFPEESSSLPPSSTPAVDYDFAFEMLEMPPNATLSPEHSELVNMEGDVNKDQENRHPDFDAHQKGNSDLGAYQNLEYQRLQRNGQRQVVSSRRQAPKSHRYPHGFHTNHNNQAPKPGPSYKRASLRSSHAAANGTKVWTVKPKSENDEGSSKPCLLIEAPRVPCQERKLLIGSITVSLGSETIQGQEGNLGGDSETCLSDHSVPSENGTCESPVIGDENQGTAMSPVSFLRESVHLHHNGGNDAGVSEVNSFVCTDSDLIEPICVVESTSNRCEDKCDLRVEGGHLGGMKFSSHLAEAFLSHRWKDAITADHVELVLFPESPPGHSVAPQENSIREAVSSSELDESSVLCSTENRLPVHSTVDSKARVKSKSKAKRSKVKYIQKQQCGF